MRTLNRVLLHSLCEQKYADQNNSLGCLKQRKICWNRQDKFCPYDEADLTNKKTASKVARITSKWQETPFLWFSCCWIWINSTYFFMVIINFEQISLIVQISLFLTLNKDHPLFAWRIIGDFELLTCLTENNLLYLYKCSLNTLLYSNITYFRLVSRYAFSCFLQERNPNINFNIMLLYVQDNPLLCHQQC